MVAGKRLRSVHAAKPRSSSAPRTTRPRSGRVGSSEAGIPQVCAVVDIGSNSTHLYVAVSDGVRQEVIADESMPIELGRLVEQDRTIGRKATAAISDALSSFRDRATTLGANRMHVVATEPFRRARDQEIALRALRGSKAGAPVVLTHEEEGLLTVLGLQHGHDHSVPQLVVDIGGGSTEAVELHPGELPRAFGVSIGSARLLARVSYQDPPRPREWQELRRHAQIALADLTVADVHRLILVGGTATRLLKLVPATLISRTIHREDLAEMGQRLVALTAKEVAERFAISQRRARLLPAGIAIVEALLQRTTARVVTVDRGGIREGLVVAVARSGEGWREALPALVMETRESALR
jgi:exopolyphosphatase / guanosine-5'-triphosphate,3'-diphosphate pyrophosphatase